MIPEFPFSARYTTIKGFRMHYIDEGEGEPIILVHGNPTWSYYYRHVIALLSRKYRVIAPDHIGCGLSDKPSTFSYTLKNHIDNLAALLAELGIGKTSMIVHDWGGAIGLGAAALHDISLDKLVILNTAAFRSERIPFRISVCRWPYIGAFLVKGINGFAGAATVMAVKRRMPREIAAAYLQPYASWRQRIAVHEFVRDIPMKANHPSYQTLVQVEHFVDDLGKAPPPVMILWGGRDFCFNDSFFAEWKRRFPAAECHYFDQYGHYVLEDGRGQVEPIIETFLGVKAAALNHD